MPQGVFKSVTMLPVLLMSTMGVGSVAVGAAAGGVGDRKASVEADTSRMGKAVAQQIRVVMISQKWIAVQQPEAQ